MADESEKIVPLILGDMRFYGQSPDYQWAVSYRGRYFTSEMPATISEIITILSAFHAADGMM